MKTRYRWIVAGVAASAALGVLGCRFDGGAGDAGPAAPPDAAGAAAPSGAAGGDPAAATSALRFSTLAERPLYAFSEVEVGRYLPIARRIEPELGRRVVHLGRKNLGQPYDIYLLGEFPYELIDPDPIYCLTRSDCVTFCEHMYAMALSEDWWGFLRALQRLRYRNGVVGMLTRNHYTLADWDRNNAFLFEDRTASLGGGTVQVPLTQVCRRADFFARFGIGQDIPDEPIEDRYIPKERVPEILDELRDGDFVNIVRGNERDQYVGHTGLIAIAGDGTVNFLHSARPRVREQPLTDYLASDRRCLGIRILRLRPDAERILRDELAASPAATEVSGRVLRAALADTPLMPTGAPAWYTADWMRAMRLQAYRLDDDTPVDDDLQAALEALDAEVGAALGIPDDRRAFGVLELRDRRLAMVRPDAIFYGASVPKICIVLGYFAQDPSRLDSLDPQTQRELERVIKRSDNELAAKYSQIVGLEYLQELVQSPRYRFYDAKRGGGLWCGKHYGIDEPRIGEPVADHSHAATVRQCLRFYLLMEQGKLESAAVSAKLKEIFAAPELEFNNERFVKGLNGRDVTILRKSGWWEDWYLDTARVQHGEHLYLLAGMVEHPQGSEYLAQMAARVDELLCGPPQPTPHVHELLAMDGTAAAAAGVPDVPPVGPDVVLMPTAGQEAEYTSPVLRPRMWFNEVVVSWNADVPAAAGIGFELRVGRQADDLWSPWLYVGAWGAVPPAGERVTKFDGGRIDVDYFRSDERYDRLQIRARAAGDASSDGPVRVHRLVACASDTSGIPYAITPPQHDDDAHVLPAVALDVPFHSQHTKEKSLAGLICSPTSVAMVMGYRGVDEPVLDVARTCFDPAHKIYGNWPQNVQAAYSLGVPGYLTRFSSWERVAEAFARGQPLIASFRMHPGDPVPHWGYFTDGHLIVLRGFDDEGNVLINDPAYRTPEKGCRTVRRDELELIWMRNVGGLAYVLLPPEENPPAYELRPRATPVGRLELNRDETPPAGPAVQQGRQQQR